MARLSRATINVPAAGPNATAAVRVKTSEIEKFAGAPGIFRTAEPLNSVSDGQHPPLAARRSGHRDALDRPSQHHTAGAHYGSHVQVSSATLLLERGARTATHSVATCRETDHAESPKFRLIQAIPWRLFHPRTC